MRTNDFDYSLPPPRIAQHPTPQRDLSRLLVLHRSEKTLQHRPTFPHLLEFLAPGDVLVLNDSKVMPARLRGRKLSSPGEVEILLLWESSLNEWWVLLRPGKRVRPGTRLVLSSRHGQGSVEAVVLEKNQEGHCRLQFCGPGNIRERLEQFGEVPLPPYISRRPEAEDLERYQTVFASALGSIAAPTAGLHFTTELIAQIRARGVEIHTVTLHVGLGTFLPVKVENAEEHRMHTERFVVSEATAQAVNLAKEQKRRVMAVGTTTVRVLESVAAENGGRIVAGAGQTDIFIYPPFRFQVVDALLTNFHLPRSTLLMLVAAFAAPGETSGRDLVLRAYAEAVQKEYRFFSYGDAMLLL